jgi:hypothetical protein
LLILQKRNKTENQLKKVTWFKSLSDDSPIPLWEENFSVVKDYLIELKLMNQNAAFVGL